MTKEQIKLAFQLSVEVYNKKRTLKEAKEIGSASGISPNSINYYCAAYRHMMNGTVHTGSIGAEVREYFLEQIFKIQDASVKRSALYSFEQAIIYRENRQNCSLPTDRKILEKYKKMIEIQ